MQAAKATPGIFKMCGSQKLLDQLTECNKLLESVQKVCAAPFRMLLYQNSYQPKFSTYSAYLFLQARFCNKPQLAPHPILYINEWRVDKNGHARFFLIFALNCLNAYNQQCMTAQRYVLHVPSVPKIFVSSFFSFWTSRFPNIFDVPAGPV